MMLTIRVKKIVFSAAGGDSEDATGAAGEASTSSGVPAAASSSDGSTLHISGPVSSESDLVKMGAYHTLDLEAGRDFTLIKAEGGWDSIGIDRVKEATEVGGGAELGAIVCGEGRPRLPVHIASRLLYYQVLRTYAYSRSIRLSSDNG
jgi:protein pelota